MILAADSSDDTAGGNDVKLENMRSVALTCVLLYASPLLGVAVEDGFISLSGDNQHRNWSGDGKVWTLRTDEISGYSTGQSSTLVYEDQTFENYVLRFSAQVQTGSVRILLRNAWFGWVMEVGTEKVVLRGGGGDGFVAFLRKPGEWAEYEVRVQRGSVKLVQNGKPDDLEYVAAHMPETGKISLQLAEAEQGSKIVIRNLRIRELQ